MQPKRNDENDPSTFGVIWITNKPLLEGEGTRSFLHERKHPIFRETSRRTAILKSYRIMCILHKMMVLSVKPLLHLGKKKKATLWSLMKSPFPFWFVLLCYFSFGSVFSLSVTPDRVRLISHLRKQYRRKGKRSKAQSMNRLSVPS